MLPEEKHVEAFSCTYIPDNFIRLIKQVGKSHSNLDRVPLCPLFLCIIIFSSWRNVRGMIDLAPLQTVAERQEYCRDYTTFEWSRCQLKSTCYLRKVCEAIQTLPERPSLHKRQRKRSEAPNWDFCRFRHLEEHELRMLEPQRQGSLCML